MMSYKHWLALWMVGIAVLAGCNRNRLPDSFNPGDYSTKTLIPYTNKEKGEEGKFMVRDYEGQPQGPDLVFIQGGRHILGTMEEDVLGSLDHVERTVTVSSFYMDQTEVANIHWLEYLHFVQDSGQQYYEDALPDTTVWAKELAFNDPYVDHYFRYPGFRFFPVVGISWLQAQNYCKWRTQVVNKQ
ncbi:MAG: formylglycine-generating enzyme family protein, partial [Flammeovirgaceae bacterium]|nr:formylglycine-generating enzyme family protein [Flammeovirgaceae bacterium]MDW8287585.1 SUMF1/EgtB/PvdO family nonheme iron enzyme [Flammeovirgaceae bacterium]